MYIDSEMKKLGVEYQNARVLQEKDGITVARVLLDGRPCILKTFQNPAYRREIRNYQLLQEMNVPTPRVLAVSDSAILMEDLKKSPTYRPGREMDMQDPRIAVRLAAWYKRLHQQGYPYLQNVPGPLYDESDYFTAENIRFIKEKTGTAHAQAWKILERHAAEVRALLQKTRKTLTYNDFYYTNLAVARDASSAMMFDYNLLGRGYAYADLRNVSSSLSEEAKTSFLAAYGPFDLMEKYVDDVVCPVVTLYMACQRPRFPRWARGMMDEVQTTYEQKVRHLLEVAHDLPAKWIAGVEWGMLRDIDAWMGLVARVRQNFPGLETEEALRDHRATVERFMDKKQALCVKADGKIAGVLLFSRNRNMICCLAVAKEYRRQGVASRLLEKALSELDRSKDITVTTFRAEDEKGVAPRALYRFFGFEEGKLTVDYDYPLQEFVLHPKG